MAQAVTGAPRFEMRGVRKAFGSTVALDGVDLAVRAGEVCALVGQNGAGQEHPHEHPVRRAEAGHGHDDARRLGLRAAVAARGAPRGRRDDLSGPVARAASHGDGEHRARRRAGALRHRAIALDARRRRPARWSGSAIPTSHRDAVVGDLPPAGQQLVEIARALASGCRVLVLDEPTSSLAHDDVRAPVRSHRRLKRQGHAIVYISHFIEEVQGGLRSLRRLARRSQRRRRHRRRRLAPMRS